MLKGIGQATTAVYAASKYVGHELAMAEGEGRSILPFWIRGEKWYFCAPKGVYFAQRIVGIIWYYTNDFTSGPTVTNFTVNQP